MKINFEKFKVYTSISHKTAQAIDVRERFADMIYTGMNGIRAHTLAMKIFKSEGSVDYETEEIKLIKGIAEQFCVPGFIDGLNEQLNCQTDKNNNYGIDERRKARITQCDESGIARC